MVTGNKLLGFHQTKLKITAAYIQTYVTETFYKWSSTHFTKYFTNILLFKQTQQSSCFNAASDNRCVADICVLVYLIYSLCNLVKTVTCSHYSFHNKYNVV